MSERKRQPAYKVIKDLQAYELKALKRHSQGLIPSIKRMEFVPNVDKQGGILIGDVLLSPKGRERIRVLLGVIAPNKKAWTTLSTLPMSAYGYFDKEAYGEEGESSLDIDE